jgi:hypothetical protein
MKRRPKKPDRTPATAKPTDRLAALLPLGQAISEEEARAMGHLVTVVSEGQPPSLLPPPRKEEIDLKTVPALTAIGWIEQAGKDHPETCEEAVRSLVAIGRAVIDAIDRLRFAKPEAVREVAKIQTSWPVLLPVMPAAMESVIQSVRDIGLGVEAVSIKTRGRRFDLETPENALVVRLVREIRGLQRSSPTPKQDPNRFLREVLEAARTQFEDAFCHEGSAPLEWSKLMRRAKQEAKSDMRADVWHAAAGLLKKAFRRVYGNGDRGPV